MKSGTPGYKDKESELPRSLHYLYCSTLLPWRWSPPLFFCLNAKYYQTHRIIWLHNLLRPYHYINYDFIDKITIGFY